MGFVCFTENGIDLSKRSVHNKIISSLLRKVISEYHSCLGKGVRFTVFGRKLNFMESPSGIKIILVTHPRTGDLRESLKYIYNLYVEYVVKNPLYSLWNPIRCEMFSTTVDQYVRGLG